ncbi:MAG: hypothetical protein VX685_08675 [Actinomycetota bacterium]|nr:hypothetical protein [Actinomycetota bacterium]
MSIHLPGAALTGSARLTIDRVHHYRDTVRAYQVRVDGSQVGRVKDDKSETFEIPPGIHEVRVRLMWLQSPPVELRVEAGDEVRLRTGPNGGIAQAWRIYLAPHTALFLERVSSSR